jgi:hypothetical protein
MAVQYGRILPSRQFFSAFPRTAVRQNSSSYPKSASFIGKAELPHSETLRVASALPACRQVLECARASAALPLAHTHLYANTYTSFTIFQADATASQYFVLHPFQSQSQS